MELYFIGAGIHIKLSLFLSHCLRRQKRHHKRVILGIRPEDIRYHREKNLQKQELRGVVEMIKNTGTIQVLYLSGIIDKWMSVRVNSYVAVDVGKKVSITFDTQRLHLFDKESGLAIGRAARKGEIAW